MKQNKTVSCEIHIFWKVQESIKVEEEKTRKRKPVERTFPFWTCRVSNAGEYMSVQGMQERIQGGWFLWQLWLW